MDLLIILVFTLLNGVFALSEMAVASSKKALLQHYAEEGNIRAKIALALANSPSRFLSTVQVGITAIGLTNGAFGESLISSKLEVYLKDITVVAPYANQIAFVLAVVLLTFISLLFGELIPKRLALRNPEAIAMLIARPMTFLSKIASPLVSILMFCTDRTLRLFGADKEDTASVTEEEVKMLVAEGAQAGIFDSSEHQIVERVFTLDDRQVASSMTARTDMIVLDVDATLDDIRSTILNSSYSRFPVYENDRSNIIGVLHSKKLLTILNRGDNIELRQYIEKAVFVPETSTITQLLSTFKSKRTHLALVVDEYGETAGLITMFDVMQVLMGDMVVEEEHTESDIIQREDRSYLISGSTDIHEVETTLDIELRDDEFDYRTLGGFMMAKMGRIPKTADKLEHYGWVFEVIDMDERRVDKLLVRKVEHS